VSEYDAKGGGRKRVKAGLISTATSLSILPGKLSGPQALLGSIFVRTLYTSEIGYMDISVCFPAVKKLQDLRKKLTERSY
jgi:hypothetical protein